MGAILKPGLNAGVAGAGVFGGFHAAKYAALEGVRLAAVYDRDGERAAILAARFGAQPFVDYEQFLMAVDVVSIAVAAVAHGPLGLSALRAGRHAYIEKPLATEVATAQALCEEAQARGLTLACGHQERLTLEALGLIGPEAPRPRRLEAVRRAPWSGRGADISAFLDLMSHDADFALRFARAPVQGISAQGRSVQSGWLDEGAADIRFADGMEAQLSVSRVADSRERTLALIYDTGLVHIDFLSNQIRDEAGLGLPDRLPLGDPLGAAIARFVAAARGEGRPVATGWEGLAALDLVLQAESLASDGGQA